MKVLVVGGGGREHALCWKLRQSPLLTELYCAPGNPGIARDRRLRCRSRRRRSSAWPTSRPSLKIDLTIVGPELPLTLGIADEFRLPRPADLRPAARSPPRSRARRSSPRSSWRGTTSRRRRFEVVHDRGRGARGGEALRLSGGAQGRRPGRRQGRADRHATPRSSKAALDAFFDERRFGASADRVVVEALLDGEEVSFMALCDGERILPLRRRKDYKRIGDGDTGPNTGGMGAPQPVGGPRRRGSRPRSSSACCVRRWPGSPREDRPFVGVLYAGADADRGRSEGARVQRPLRRSRGAGAPAAARGRPAADPRRPARAAPSTTSALVVSPRGRGCLVLASAGYPGSAGQGRADRRPRGGVA